jgi:glutathione S-transferase
MTPNDLKLYQSNGSPNARRVRIFLAEKGVCMPMIPVDLGAKEQFSAAYAAVNPRQVVPTLVLGDGTAIGEVPAIWRYLEEIYPETPLLGRTPKEKALVAMWERRMEREGFAPTVEAVRNAAPGLAGRAIAGPHGYDQIPALVERGRARVADFHADLDALLTDRPFVAGDTYSVADSTARVTLDFAAGALAMPSPEGARAIARWCDALSARPSTDA